MPARYEENILGFIPQEEWLNMGFRVNRPNDPIDGLFGDERSDNLVAKWQSIANEYQIPVMAQFHGFDTEAQTTFRVPVDNHNIEKGLIKVKINQSERMRALTRAGVRNDEMFDYVVNDGIRLADQVVTRTKVAKNELMATGKITIKENNLDIKVDYGVPAEQTAFTLDLSPEADIAAQIQVIIDYATEKGVTITGILTSKKNLTKMRSNKYLQVAINGNVSAGALVRQSALEAYFSDEFNINTIITNDLTYGASAVIDADGRPSVKTSRYFPENKVTFFATNPGGRMGIGLWGNPPEVDAGQYEKVSASGQSPYVYIMQWMEKDPAVLWTKASGLFMPVLYNPQSLFIATVDDEFLDKATIAPESQASSVFEVPVSSIQGNDMTVSNGALTGTSKWLAGPNGITAKWGAGNFIVLKWSDIDPKATSIKVGLEPSAGTGLVECYEDLDRNGIFKITNKNIQKFKMIISDGVHARVQYLDLSGLTLQSAE